MLCLIQVYEKLKCAMISSTYHRIKRKNLKNLILVNIEINVLKPNSSN
jgi:hypothetical protein